MNNLTEVNTVAGEHSFKENKKEEITTDIEENSKDSNTNTNIERRIDKDKNITDKDNITVDIKKELEVEECGKKIEEKLTIIEYGTERKPPAIWVQYNQQAYGQGQGYNQSYGGQEYGQGPQHNYGGGHYYGGAPLEYDPQSRNLFVKWVFIILLVMFIITAAIAIFILATPGVKTFYQETGLLLMIASMIVLVGMNYVMACSACARVPPCNFISLFIVVLAMSNLVGAVTVKYKTHILVFAVIATVVTVAVCVLLACSNFDFTKWYLYVVAIAVAFVAISMMVSIAMLVLKIRYKPLQIAMLFIGGLINVVILVMELQMILGGKAIEMGEDDYALAAYLLYSSIVDIFLKIVQIMGLFDE